MIPKNIIQIWMQDLMPEKYCKNIQSVKKLNPDWKYARYDESSIREIVKSLGDNYLRKFDSLPLLHQKVDFGRYALLYKFGGVSVDMDVVALKSFNDTPHINDSDFIVSKNSTDRFINNATIMVSKENPLMKKLLDELDTQCKWYQDKTACVMYSTGPMAFTKFLNKHWGEITVLDNKYFEPCSGRDKNCTLGPDAILDHQHEGSWVSPIYNNMREAMYSVKPHKTIIFIAIILMILFFILRK